MAYEAKKEAKKVSGTVLKRSLEPKKVSGTVSQRFLTPFPPFLNPSNQSRKIARRTPTPGAITWGTTMNRPPGVTVTTTPSVGTILYEKPLTKIDWSPFARTARLIFGYSDADTTISLYGIHFFATRQTTLGPVEDAVGIDCIVRFADVREHSAFLEKFLGGALGFDSMVYLYDLAGHPQGTPDFVQPRHLSIVCDSGQLDVIFERITILCSVTA